LRSRDSFWLSLRLYFTVARRSTSCEECHP
jgi:hypothetical protein